jgi:hypothetical protein
MGIFWDLTQQDELHAQDKKAESLEKRVVQLENELANTKKLFKKKLVALEEHVLKDIYGDGNLEEHQSTN